MTDLYNTLGIDRNADQDTIKKAYRKLAAQFHPDKNKAPDAENKFKEINNAYEVLSDPEKKEKYDQFGVDGLNGNMPNMGGFPFADIFGGAFGGAFGGGFPFEFNFNNNFRQHQVTKKDISIKIELTYEEIYLGCNKTIKYGYLKKCNECNGNGGETQKCSDCNGNGRIKIVKRMGMMAIQQETTCGKCNGSGKMVINKCVSCNGNKNIESVKEFNIDIPVGIKPEHNIIKQNGGHEIDNVVSDLRINIEEKPHKIYKRDDKNIKCKININLIEALTGYQKEFILLDGSKILYSTKEITKPNSKLRLKGKGFSDINNKNDRGDLLCYITIDFPENLDANWIEELVMKTNRNDINNDNNFEVIIDRK
jgi:molecular chaperone DnaJ